METPSSIQDGAEVIYGETSGIYPQQKPETKNVFNTDNWDEESWSKLQEARAYVADISERNRMVHRQDKSGSKNSIEKNVWWQSEMAAGTAARNDLPSDVRHFFLRQDGEGVQQPGWAEGETPWRSFGPFLKPGDGGDVPKGDKVYIDIYRGIK